MRGKGGIFDCKLQAIPTLHFKKWICDWGEKAVYRSIIVNCEWFNIRCVLLNMAADTVTQNLILCKDGVVTPSDRDNGDRIWPSNAYIHYY